jgi:ubiquinol-cytochrome c reductase cytochrome b subunit
LIKKALEFFVKRLGFDVIAKNVLYRKVAKTPWYQGDGATLVILLSVQVLTGAVLTLSYSNSIHLAYTSVEFITHVKIFGWFIRGLHYWSAGLMMVMLMFHLFRLLLVGGYKAPREGTWFTGVILFFLVTIMAFSGYVLRWDERGIYAVKVLLHMLDNIPLIGEELVLFVQAGNEINAHTLTRFFSVHVIIVPVLLLAMVGYHLFLVIRHGPTSMAERNVPVSTAEEHEEVYDEAKHSKEEGEDFYPMTMASSGAMGFLVLMIGIILTLTLGPPELYPEANLTKDAFPKEEWWFWWYSSAIALLPPKVVPLFLVWFPISLCLFLLALPLIDRGPNRGISKRPLWLMMVTLATVILLGLTAIRTRSPWTGWPDSTLPPFPKNYFVTPEIERGRELYVKYGCNSCHAVAGFGPKVGPDITKIEKRLTRDEIESVILDPPKKIAMPSYKCRMSEEELKYVTEFVFVLQIQARSR